jgi:MFS family permease
MAFGDSVALAFAGIAVWGVHMGLTEGLISALTADAAPPTLRGTAFGVVNLARGLMLIASSALAGALWSWHGHEATFLAGAALAAAAALASLMIRA